MNEILRRISALGIIPVIKIDDLEKAVPLAKALCDGGLPCAEVTFRTANAEEAIRRITSAYPEMLVGAGTVLTIEQADKAIAAGASFIISPGLNPKVVRYCLDRNITMTPGCSNPSDIEQAIELGLDAVKFFPAEAAGGLAMIKAMSAPYTDMKFIPTGGINAKNLNEYLRFAKILACGGSWMVSDELLAESAFDQITALTKEAIAIMLGFELAHVGINAANEQEAAEAAANFSRAFGLEYRPGGSSIFAGSALEVMKSPFLGKNGHLAMLTNSVSRAMHYLESRGFAFDMETAKRDVNGSILAIYLKDEMGGFAVHLLQRK